MRERSLPTPSSAPIEARAAGRALGAGVAHRLAGEDGMAMIMATVVSAVLLTLVGGAVMVSVQSRGATTRDNSTKAADEAVEAGLRVALYRLNEIQPAPSNCINTNSAVTPTADGTCHDTTETLSTGATFTYYTTPALGTGSTCVGYYVTSSTGLTQRCITVSASVNGITRRAQVRAVSYAASPLFPVPGLIGLKSVDITNNAHVVGSVATDGTITLDNNAVVASNGSDALILGPSGDVTAANNASFPTPVLKRTPAQGPFTLSPVDPGNSAYVNDDSRITNYFTQSFPQDQSSGCTMGTTPTSCWNPAARTLNLENNATITLGGGIYNFCSFNAANNVTITIANGARVAIYIDSASRPGSNCPSGKIPNGGGNGYAGWFNVRNNSSMVNPSQDPTGMIVYIYDNSGAVNNGVSSFSEANNAAFYGTLYAPLSSIDLSNNAGVVGAVAANQLTLDQNFNYTWDGRDGSLQASSAGVYFRTAWRQCLTAPSSLNNPQSGC